MPTSDSVASSTTSRVKLRSSCDRCSANKIKCSQEKPACQRCRSLDLQCIYSRSMRSGKPPRSRQRMTTLAGSRPAASSSGLSAAAVDDIKIVSHGDAAASVPCLEGINLESMLATNAATNQYGLFYENSPLGTPEKFLINASVEYAPNRSFSKQGDTGITDMPTPLPLLQTVDNSPEHKQQAPYMTPCPSFSNTPMDTGFSPLGPPFDKPSMSDSSHDCIGLALGTLASLYQLSSSPYSNGTVEELQDNFSSSAPTIDQVLQTNSAAIKNAMTLLACPCAKDFCFPILMGVIYSKILTWYQAIVNIDDDNNDPDVMNGNNSSSNDIYSSYSPSKKESVAAVYRPFLVGSYRLDEEIGRIMTQQLVLNELREMAKAVGVFLDGFCGSSHNNNNNNNMPRTRCSGEHIYLRMGISLDARLRYTIQELEKILPTNQS
ncbi:hypothetical protein VTN96DRAFT_4665 [Rasamsonia emersonii]